MMYEWLVEVPLAYEWTMVMMEGSWAKTLSFITSLLVCFLGIGRRVAS